MLEFILPYGLLIGAVGTGAVLWSKWMIERAADSIEERHRALEMIVNDGEVPVKWIAKYRQRAAALRGAGGTQADLEAVVDVARRSVGREADRLVKYMRTTRLVADEDTREQLVAGIADRRHEWDEAGWSQIVDPVDLKGRGPTNSGVSS